MAIKALAWMVRAFEPPVYCYHEIVHNQLVVRRFEESGVIFVDDIDEVLAGRPIMLSAHGSAPEVVAAARARGGYVVDAVSPRDQGPPRGEDPPAGKGYTIVYVGHEGHEEAVGTMAVASMSSTGSRPPRRSTRSPSSRPRSRSWPRPRCRIGSGPACSTPPAASSPSLAARTIRPLASRPPIASRR
ncbi:MAG: hypothetical protein R2695_17515 [Acidimicrobiales bacterium]